MSVIPAERLAEVFVEFADTLVDDFNLIEFLQTLTGRVADLTGASAVGLLMADSRDQLHFMAASDERVHLLDLFQIQADEGPCRDCFHLGRAVSVADLRRAGGRWPSFATEAIEAGYVSVQAFPLRLRQQVIGSLGLFGVAPEVMVGGDARIVQALADVATIGILQERAVHRGEVLAGQLQGALDSRVVIEQAKGMIAQRYKVSLEEAFRLLRIYCRSTHQRLHDVAMEIAADGASIPDLSSGSGSGPTTG